MNLGYIWNYNHLLVIQTANLTWMSHNKYKSRLALGIKP